MSSEFCIMQSSAAPYNTKQSTLVQETIRRMSNTSLGRDKEEKETTLNKFTAKLARRR